MVFVGGGVVRALQDEGAQEFAGGTAGLVGKQVAVLRVSVA